MNKKSCRNFKFSIDNYTDMDIAGIILMAQDHAIYTIARFDNSTINGYIYFGDRKQSIDGIKRKWLQNAEITIVESCKMFNKSDYVNGTEYEFGEEPRQGKIKKSNIEKIIKSKKKSNILDKCDKNYEAFEKLQSNYESFFDFSKKYCQDGDWQFLLVSFYNSMNAYLLKLVMNGTLANRDHNCFNNYIYNSMRSIFYYNQLNKVHIMSNLSMAKGLLTLNGIKIIDNCFDMMTKKKYKIKKNDEPKMLMIRFFRIFLPIFHKLKEKQNIKEINEFNKLMDGYNIKYDSSKSFFDIYNGVYFEVIEKANNGHIIRMIDFYEQ